MPISLLLQQQMTLLLVAVAVTESAISSSVICLPLYFFEVTKDTGTQLGFPIILVSGYLVSLTTASYFGSLSDRIGRRPLLITGTALIGLSFIPLPILYLIYAEFQYGFMVILVINVIKGLASSMMSGPILAMFADLSPKHNHGETMGKFYLSRSAGGASGFLIGGMAWDFFSSTSFYFFAFIMFIACALYFFRLFEPRTAVQVEEDENIQALSFSELVADSEMDINPFKTMLESLQDKQFRKFAIALLAYTTLIGAGGTYAPVIITQASEQNLPTSLIGLIFLAGVGIMGIIQPTLGKLSDKLGRKPFLILGVFGTSLLLVMLTAIIALPPEDMVDLISFPLAMDKSKPLEFVPEITIPFPHLLIIICVVIFLICAACFTSSSLGMITDVTKEGHRGREMGFTQAIMSTGSILGASFGATFLSVGGPLGVMSFCFGLSLIAVIIIIQFLYETSGFYHFTHKLV
jgi:MFS family permease